MTSEKIRAGVQIEAEINTLSRLLRGLRTQNWVDATVNINRHETDMYTSFPPDNVPHIIRLDQDYVDILIKRYEEDLNKLAKEFEAL